MSYLIPSDNQIEDFCLAIIQGKTNGQAFRAAFPDSDALDTTATNHGSKIAKLPVIRARLDQLSELAVTEGNKACVISITRRKELLSQAAEHGLSIDDDRLKDAAAGLKAIDIHNKMDGAYVQDEYAGVTVIISHDPVLDEIE